MEVLILAALMLLIGVWQLNSGATRAEGTRPERPIRAVRQPQRTRSRPVPTRDHDLGGTSLGVNYLLARAPDTSGGDVDQPLLVLD